MTKWRKMFQIIIASLYDFQNDNRILLVFVREDTQDYVGNAASGFFVFIVIPLEIQQAYMRIIREYY